MRSASSKGFYLILILLVLNVFIATGQTTGEAPPPGNQTSTGAPAPAPGNQTTSSPTTPATRDRLRIAVPVSTYKEFVSITIDPLTREQHIGGFSIEVFRAVINTAVSDPPEYIFMPFAQSNGSFNGSFDAMLQAVSNQVC